MQLLSLQQIPEDSAVPEQPYTEVLPLTKKLRGDCKKKLYY